MLSTRLSVFCFILFLTKTKLICQLPTTTSPNHQNRVGKTAFPNSTPPFQAIYLLFMTGSPFLGPLGRSLIWRKGESREGSTRYYLLHFTTMSKGPAQNYSYQELEENNLLNIQLLVFHSMAKGKQRLIQDCLGGVAYCTIQQIVLGPFLSHQR